MTEPIGKTFSFKQTKITQRNKKKNDHLLSLLEQLFKMLNNPAYNFAQLQQPCF